MTAPRVPGNTRTERRAMLTRVGCPAALLDDADRLLKVLVTPVYVNRAWKVPAHLSDIEARRVVRRVRADRGWSA
jgi:hypothetical protein